MQENEKVLSYSQASEFSRVNIEAGASSLEKSTVLHSFGVIPTGHTKLTSLAVRALRGPRFVSAWVTAPAMKFSLTRDRGMIPERTIFMIVNAGEIRVAAERQSITLKAGEAGWIPPGRSQLNLESVTRRNEVLVLSVFLRAADLKVQAAMHGPQLVSDRSLTTYGFMAGFGLAMAPPPGTIDVALRLQEAARSIGKTLSSSGPEDTDYDLYTAAYRFIKMHASDPTVSCATIAEHFGVSERTLQARFKGKGLTVARTVRATRAAIAHELRYAEPRIPVASLVRAAGFRSPRQLHRALIEFPSSKVEFSASSTSGPDPTAK